MGLTRPKSAQVNFDVTNISDPLIRLNSGETGSADKDAGIVIERGNDTNVAILYDESADQFAVVNTSETGTTSGNVTISSYANIKADEFHGDGSNLTGISAGTGDISFSGSTISSSGSTITLDDAVVTSGKLTTNGTYDGYGNNLMGNDETLAIISKTNYKAAYSLRHNGSGSDGGTTVLYHATQASMTGSGSDISAGIYMQNGQRWGIGHGTTRAVEVTSDGDVRSRYWVGNGTGSGYKLNADGNQGMILIETNLTTTRDLMHFNNGNGLVGRIQTSSSSTTYNTSSDYRLKAVSYTHLTLPTILLV